MADIFVNSGEQSNNVVVPTPSLNGIFIQGLDQPDIIDGFGEIIPFGGGSTARKYFDYGVSAEVSRQNTMFNDLASALIPGQGGGTSYDFDGLIGPQGPIGPPGPPGITTFLTVPYNSNFLTALPDVLAQINQLGTAADKMLYTSAATEFRNFVWAATDIEAGVSSWNESGINTDASFFIIAANDGIYVSTDGGDNWSKYNPDSDSYEQTNSEASGGNAVVLGAEGKDRGAILLTTDYGVSWSEVTVTV